MFHIYIYEPMFICFDMDLCLCTDVAATIDGHGGGGGGGHGGCPHGWCGRHCCKDAAEAEEAQVANTEENGKLFNSYTTLFLCMLRVTHTTRRPHTCLFDA